MRDECAVPDSEAGGQVNQSAWRSGLPLLSGFWLVAAIGDRLWFACDQMVPAWDQAEYLSGALNYWHTLQTPQLLSGEWWVDLWQLSSKIPPLVYLVTTPFLSLFGAGADQSTLVMVLFSAVLMAAVYTIAAHLFSPSVGLWAAGICIFMPGLYRLRLDYLLDYPLAAMVTACFACLTLWRDTTAHLPPKSADPLRAQVLQSLLPHRHTIALGITLGLALLVKQPALLFLFVPFSWVSIELLWQRRWPKLLELVGALAIASLLIYPWYRTNWLLMLTASKRATVDSAIAEGDPSLLSIDAWLFYLRELPELVSLPLLVVPLLGLVLFWRRSRVSSLVNGQRGELDVAPKSRDYRQRAFAHSQRSLLWLLGFLVGSYVLSSLNINKDARYIVPSLPVLAIVLAYGLTLLPWRWHLWRWSTIALAALWMLLNFIPNATPASFAQHPPYIGAAFPHAQVVAEVKRVAPHLRSAIAVLPSTPEVNQHTINYYGMLQQQVHGRQVGARSPWVVHEARSFDWYLTKSGAQGSIRVPEALTALSQLIERSADLRLHKTWRLPNGDSLNLWRRRIPTIDVQSADDLQDSESVRLDQVSLPDRAPPGQPVPVTYKWSGSWNDLQSGLVLLTWRKAGSPDRWFHDHGIGMGLLRSQRFKPADRQQVIERTAMLPPASLSSGDYTLEATYLNRLTGETVPILTPAIRLRIDPTAAPTAAPEVDRVTQLRNLSAALPQGRTAFERIFDDIGRLGQSDPTLDYLRQTQQAMAFRLQQEPQNRIFAYGLALAYVLQRDVSGAIAALEHVTQLDAQNPFAFAYLAFVNLYDLRPAAAQSALNTALTLNPNLPELHLLKGVAALMQGNVMQAWQQFTTSTAQR